MTVQNSQLCEISREFVSQVWLAGSVKSISLTHSQDGGLSGPSSLTQAAPAADKTRVPMRKTYLVCYDVCDDRRLHRVHKIMRGYGDRLQYSVFECQLTAADLVRCRHRLAGVIDHSVDQVIFVDLGPVEGRGDRVITAIGKPYAPFDSPCIVVDGLKE